MQPISRLEALSFGLGKLGRQKGGKREAKGGKRRQKGPDAFVSGPAAVQAVDFDRHEGNRLGADGTPFFFINGHAISGGVGLSGFKRLIDAALAESAPKNGK